MALRDEEMQEGGQWTGGVHQSRHQSYEMEVLGTSGQTWGTIRQRFFLLALSRMDPI